MHPVRDALPLMSTGWHRPLAFIYDAGFQFLRKTLSGLRDDDLIESDALFDKAAQNSLAIALMTRRGLGRYLAGSLSAEDFAVNLAKEWASLPVPNGRAQR